MYSEREEGNLAEQPEVNGRLNGLPVYGRPQTQQLALAQLATWLVLGACWVGYRSSWYSKIWEGLFFLKSC